MAALEVFEAAEANLVKLERVWSEIDARIPGGICFGNDPDFEDRTRAFTALQVALPKIDGWAPTAVPLSLNEIAQNRFDAMEVGEPGIETSVEESVEAPGRELREYRFRLSRMRRSLTRDALIGLIESIDADIASLRARVGTPEKNIKIDGDLLVVLRDHVLQVDALLGSAERPARWSELRRHLRFGETGDLDDIETVDWPQVRGALRKSLYGELDPVPVAVDDLASLVAAKPRGPVTSKLIWSNIDDEQFERLIFTLISDTPGYENPEWLMQTRAPDRGRDLSVTRIQKDELSGTSRQRIVIQCKHWLGRSVSLPEVAAVKDQMLTWSDPIVDVLIFATSGRFTADAVTWIEKHNHQRGTPRIEMWAESHLERLLAARPGIIAEFGLRH